MLRLTGVEFPNWHVRKRAFNSALTLPNQEYALVPIGAWLLEEPQVIANFARWRYEARESFFARFPESVDGMTRFLEIRYLNSQDAQLFGLADSHGSIHGHIGLKNMHGDCATLDSVMKGPHLQSSGIMRGALMTLLEWSEEILGLQTVDLQVISTNHRAIQLYENAGFKLVAESALRETWSGDSCTLEEVADGEANVPERSCAMRIRFDENASMQRY